MTTNRNQTLREMLENRHPSVRGVGKHLNYDEYMPHRRAVAKPFAYLAAEILDKLPDSPELTVMLRKIVEARDCCIRAADDARESGPAQEEEEDGNILRLSKDDLPKFNWSYWRKPGLTMMTRIEVPFEVPTSEGDMRCEDGWLAIDSEGNIYPISDKVQQSIYVYAHAAHYTPLEEDDDVTD